MPTRARRRGPARRPARALVATRRQHVQHPAAQLGRIEHHRVGAVADDLLGQGVQVGVAHRHDLEPGRQPDLTGLVCLGASGSFRRPATTAQGRALARPDGDRGRAVGFAGSQRAGQGPQIEVLGHLVGTDLGEPTRLVGDPGQLEHPGGLPVGVEADHVPAALRGRHAPRFEGAPLAAPVGEGDPDAIEHRRPQGLERLLARLDRGFEGGELGGVRLDAGRPQLGQRALGGLGHAGVLPDPGGDPHHGRLVGIELDRRQLELRRLDPVARLVVEEGVERTDLDRDAERAQLVLVPLEGALERGVGQIVVALDRLADLALG